jgi:hypothetical protein
MNTGIFFNSMIGNVYGHVWSKYRPVILKMMIASEGEPQQYKFSSHEFKGANPKEKGSFAFTLQAFQGRAVNNIRSSEIAQSLMGVLQQSRKATELLEKETYEFVMDKQFILHIKKQADVLTPQ